MFYIQQAHFNSMKKDVNPSIVYKNNMEWKLTFYFTFIFSYKYSGSNLQLTFPRIIDFSV